MFHKRCNAFAAYSLKVADDDSNDFAGYLFRLTR